MCLTGPIGRFLQALLGKLWLLRDCGKWVVLEVLEAWAAPCGATTSHCSGEEEGLASPRALAMAPTAALCFTSNDDDLHRERWLCGYF